MDKIYESEIEEGMLEEREGKVRLKYKDRGNNLYNNIDLNCKILKDNKEVYEVELW